MHAYDSMNTKYLLVCVYSCLLPVTSEYMYMCTHVSLLHACTCGMYPTQLELAMVQVFEVAMGCMSIMH